MIKKIQERNLAIELRKQGYTYSEILQRVKVAKSTLSDWLRGIKLAKKQKHRITEKKKMARLRAIEKIRKIRIQRSKALINSSKKDIKQLSKKDLFILGIALYWAEGSKQKANNISQRVSFSNSDMQMIGIFLKWLKDICKISEERLRFEVYIHEYWKDKEVEAIKNRWRKFLEIPLNKEVKIRFKRNILRKKPKLKNYNGVFRIDVSKSTDLNRIISGWIEGVIENF